MKSDFMDLCEELWRDWLEERLDLPEFSRPPFNLAAAPEPYVLYDVGSNPLVMLLTNPGGTMPHQLRENVRTAGSGPYPLTEDMRYADAAARLGEFYGDMESKRAARARVDAMKNLARLSGHSGVIQVDACPFHSENLPMVHKLRIVRMSGEAGFMQRYSRLLRSFLEPHSVVVVTGAGSGKSLDSADELPEWPAWNAGLLGLTPRPEGFIELVGRDGSQGPKKTTVAALVQRNGNIAKALVRSMGNNNLPAKVGLEELARAIKAS
jgi:hypothetical protein